MTLAAPIRLRVLPRLIPVDGKNIELQTTATEVQWRVEGDAAWETLVPLSEITGPMGPQGVPGNDGGGVPNGGTIGQVLAKSSNDDQVVVWTDAGSGDMVASVYAPNNPGDNAFDRANHAGTETIKDSELLIIDPSDATKKVRLDAGGVTAGQTRVLTMADKDVDLSAMPADIAFRRANILGSVAMSGGVPTGAVIESGTTATGEYVKFANGWMICTHQILTGVATNSTAGSIFMSPATTNMNFPVAFVTRPSVTVMGMNSSANGWALTAVLPTATQWGQYRTATYASDSGTSGIIFLQAVGRWV